MPIVERIAVATNIFIWFAVLRWTRGNPSSWRPGSRFDERLFKSSARANHRFEEFKAGRTYAVIAQSAGPSKRRVQQMTDRAFLAPDIVRAIAESRQPSGLTSDWLLRRDLPSGRDRQRAIVASLRVGFHHRRMGEGQPCTAETAR